MKFHALASVLMMVVSTTHLQGCGSDSNHNPPETPVELTFQQLIDNAVDGDVPGIILNIDGPQQQFIGSAGLADVDNYEAMQPFHQMPAGSAGKKATALLALLLQQEGLLDIDTPITEWLPASILDNIPYSDQFTLRLLLNHTAGVHDYLDDDTREAWFDAGIASIDELKTDIDALEFIYGKDAYFAPGSGFRYSNSGYLLVGLVLDEILGEHHHTALRNRVLIPLGLNNTYYSGVEKALGSIISGYLNTGDEILNTKPFYDNVGVADAPLVTTVSDLSSLLRAIVTEDSFISDDIRSLMFGEENLVEIEPDTYYGMGLIKDNVDGRTVIHHGGDEAGYNTENLYIVDTDTVVTLFVNCNGYEACDEKTDALVQKLLARVL